DKSKLPSAPAADADDVSRKRRRINSKKHSSESSNNNNPSNGSGVHSNGLVTGLDINRPDEPGGSKFAFAFDFGEDDLDLDAEIVESADVEFPQTGGRLGEEEDDDGTAAATGRQRQLQRPPAASNAEFHPLRAGVQLGLDFFAARPKLDDDGEFLDAWRQDRDFIKADVARAAKRAASAKKLTGASGGPKSGLKG
ncbi:hypothetical protein BOX15_Mlig026144g2, partial [Macrostomum lignano]